MILEEPECLCWVSIESEWAGYTGSVSMIIFYVCIGFNQIIVIKHVMTLLITLIFSSYEQERTR